MQCSPTWYELVCGNRKEPMRAVARDATDLTPSRAGPPERERQEPRLPLEIAFQLGKELPYSEQDGGHLAGHALHTSLVPSLFSSRFTREGSSSSSRGPHNHYHDHQRQPSLSILSHIPTQETRSYRRERKKDVVGAGEASRAGQGPTRNRTIERHLPKAV